MSSILFKAFVYYCLKEPFYILYWNIVGVIYAKASIALVACFAQLLDLRYKQGFFRHHHRKENARYLTGPTLSI